MLFWLFNLLLLSFSTATAQTLAAPVVDLHYALYKEYYSPTYAQHIYKGIKYAAPPIGKQRWQLPQKPSINREQIIRATESPPQCPQSGFAVGPAEIYGKGNEDYLFLNIFAPANSTSLPVMVYIHGGGYGMGSAGMYDFSEPIHTNGNTYMAVIIQYRLEAFGYLSSAELARSGVPNAGLHDIYASLLWVQQYIERFGGDPRQVTISGESAGAGAAMLMGMANGGNDGTSLFQGIIAASPYCYEPNACDH